MPVCRKYRSSADRCDTSEKSSDQRRSARAPETIRKVLLSLVIYLLISFSSKWLCCTASILSFPLSSPSFYSNRLAASELVHSIPKVRREKRSRRGTISHLREEKYKKSEIKNWMQENMMQVACETRGRGMLTIHFLSELFIHIVQLGQWVERTENGVPAYKTKAKSYRSTWRNTRSECTRVSASELLGWYSRFIFIIYTLLPFFCLFFFIYIYICRSRVCALFPARRILAVFSLGDKGLTRGLALVVGMGCHNRWTVHFAVHCEQHNNQHTNWQTAKQKQSGGCSMMNRFLSFRFSSMNA